MIDERGKGEKRTEKKEESGRPRFSVSSIKSSAETAHRR